MIYVECKPDEVLVRTISGFPARQVVHELKGKYGVAARLSKQNGARGMLDEDPGSVQPSYLGHLSLAQDVPAMGLQLLQDSANGNLVVVLRPRLEAWILRAAREAQVDVSRFNLPTDARSLHSQINHSLDRFQRLVEALDEAPRLDSLRQLLRL
jgi:hypothetical protein